MLSNVQKDLEDVVIRVQRQKNEAINRYLKTELVRILEEVIKSGDVVLATNNHNAYAATYIPFREKQALQSKLEAKDELLRECVWAIIDHVGMIQRSGYDENHFCPAMLKLLNKSEIMQLRGEGC